MSQSKISIRFFNDREVRAVWDEENAKWWFSVLDVVAAINNEADYSKSRNYWKYLKIKLKLLRYLAYQFYTFCHLQQQVSVG
jgi:cell filamentation protein